MTPSLSHEPRSREQIAPATDIVRVVLGDAALAAYLYGSAVGGLVQAMVDSIPIFLPGIAEGNDIGNGLLTLARIWTTLATGEVRSKDEAASWALARLPDEHQPVLAHAGAAYLGEDWRGLAPQLRLHVDHVVERIRTLATDY